MRYGNPHRSYEVWCDLDLEVITGCFPMDKKRKEEERETT